MKTLEIQKGDKTFLLAQTGLKDMLLVMGHTEGSEAVYSGLSTNWVEGLCLYCKTHLKPSGVSDVRMPNGDRILLSTEDLETVNNFLQSLKLVA